MQDTEFKQVNENQQHRDSKIVATTNVSAGEVCVLTNHGDAGNLSDAQLTSVEVQQAGKSLSFERKLTGIGRSETQLVNRESYAGLRKMGRATRAATAGILVALAIQGIGMLFDQTVGVARVENHVLLNWLNLLFAPFSFISRIYNPDGPMAVSWSDFPLVVFANAGYFVAGAKLLELIFKRALRKLENDEAGLTQSSAS